MILKKINNSFEKILFLLNMLEMKIHKKFSRIQMKKLNQRK